MNPQTQMLIAGVCLGTWQLLVNRSGFPAPVANLTILAITAVVAVPTAYRYSLPGPLTAVGVLVACLVVALVVAFRHSVPATLQAYTIMMVAGLLSGVAVWQLNDVLTRVAPVDVGGLLVLMMTAQIGTAAIYHLAMQALVLGVFSMRAALAFAFTIVAAILIPR